MAYCANNSDGKGLKATGASVEKYTSYRKLHAICIGINNYNNPEIPDLKYAENDAVRFAEILKNKYGFSDITMLLGKQATKDNINNAVAGLQDTGKISSNDGIIFFFSGHAVTVATHDKEQGFLLPVDTEVNLKNLSNPVLFRKSAIRMDELKLDGDFIPAKHILFIIDACCSGYMAAKSIDQPVNIVNAMKYSSRQVLTAGGREEKTVEHNAWGHGAFSYKLLQQLSLADKPLSASELGVWLKTTVPRLVKSQFPDMALTPQSKYLSGEGDFYFFPVNSSVTDNSEFSAIESAKPESKIINQHYYLIGDTYQKIDNRFSRVNETEVFDRHLKKRWVILPEKIFNYKNALEYMGKYHADYRMPFLSELKTLQIKYPSENSWGIVDNGYFPKNSRASRFWTSDRSNFWDGHNPYYMDLSNGKTDSCSEENYLGVILISK